MAKRNRFSARAGFLLSTLKRLAQGQDRNCPYCRSEKTEFLARKKILLELRRCNACSLMFRYPKDDSDVSIEYYQSDYSEGMTTDIPGTDEIAHLLETNFSGTDLDSSRNISIVMANSNKGKILDYGCSWGYAGFQFAKLGYDVTGFEISKPRAKFGREKLGVEIVDEFSQIDALPDNSFDVIYTRHVLEHVSNLHDAFETFQRLLKRDGTLFIFVPNAGGEDARRMGTKWGHHISEKHVLALDKSFFNKALTEFGFSLQYNSWPHDKPLQDANSDEALDGIELLVVAKYADPSTSGDVLPENQ